MSICSAVYLNYNLKQDIVSDYRFLCMGVILVQEK